MRLIRNNTFETNSSSTHSITIAHYTKPSEDNIPRNYDGVYLVSEYGDVGGGDDYYSCDTHNTEVSKLRFLINMIASVYEESSLYDEWDYHMKDDENYTKEYFKKLVNSDLFKWLKEVVLEETGTIIDYEMPDGNWFPFFETTYSEDDSMENLLGLITDENGNYTKYIFKARMKEIIFNQAIYIENENCPYGMERN